MELIIGKTAGFCFGVNNAVNKTLNILKKDKAYCLGELVHNHDVNQELINNGLEIIEDIKQLDKNKTLIIRAHGAKEQTYEEAKKCGLNIVDLTCPKVLKIHNMIKEYKQKGYYIFLIGQIKHPETIASISYCGNAGTVIQDEKEAEEAVNKFKLSNKEKVIIFSQTTFSIEKFNNIVLEIENILKEKIEVRNTICDATKLRQEETKKIAQEVDLMIIVGGKNSSNTNKLFDIANKFCKKAILIENKKELNIDNIKSSEKIGIMAGASTPEKSIKIVVEFLNTMC